MVVPFFYLQNKISEILTHSKLFTYSFVNLIRTAGRTFNKFSFFTAVSVCRAFLKPEAGNIFKIRILYSVFLTGPY